MTTPLCELDEVETFFYLESVPYIEDLERLTQLAIERAAAEKLSYRAGAVFEWSSGWCEDLTSFYFEAVELRLAGALLDRQEFFGVACDEIRRVIEADILIKHAALLAEHVN